MLYDGYDKDSYDVGYDVLYIPYDGIPIRPCANPIQNSGLQDENNMLVIKTKKRMTLLVNLFFIA